MAESAQAAKYKELRIVVDTNIIFTSEEAQFVSYEMRKLLNFMMPGSRLALKWYVPDVVLKEREFQLRKYALNTQQKIEKLGNLIDRDFRITAEGVATSLAKSLRRQAAELGLQVIRLKSNRVNWRRVIEDAVNRNPPFVDAEKNEKGFRDTLILETCVQFASEPSNGSGNVVLVFAVADKLLREAIRHRLRGSENVRVVESLDDLKGLINTLADSEVDEQFIDRLKPRVEKFFFDPENNDSIEKMKQLIATLKTRFNSELESHPPSVTLRVNLDRWTIEPPSFLKKEGTRFYWRTRIVVHAVGYVRSVSAQMSSGSLPSGITPSGSAMFIQPTFFPNLGSPDQSGVPLYSAPPFSGGYFSSPAEDFVGARGETVFTVQWSVTVSQTDSLSDFEIGELTNEGTTWGQ